jgi:hypothetical protein
MQIFRETCAEQIVRGHGMPAEGEGTYLESGTISYGTLGKVKFKTVGQAVLGPVVEGVQRGAAIREVFEGEGQFAGATGFITSNFSVAASGALVDSQCTQLVLP